jgi:hypothetical protein
VVLTHEYRRLSIWPNVLSLVFEMLPGHEDHWSVLSVRSDSAVLARRRFDDDDVANRVRSRFVERVRAMSDAAFEQADWQVVLDDISIARWASTSSLRVPATPS